MLNRSNNWLLILSVVLWSQLAFANDYSEWHQRLRGFQYSEQLPKDALAIVGSSTDSSAQQLRYAIAEYLYRTGRYEASLELIPQLINNSPKNYELQVKANLLGGKAKTRLGEKSSASKMGQEALRLALLSKQAELINLAQVEGIWISLESGQFKAAIQPLFELYADKNLQQSTHYTKLLLNLAKSYAEAGLDQEALSHLETTFSQKQELAEIDKRFARLLQAKLLGNLNRSIDQANTLKAVAEFARNHKLDALNAQANLQLSKAAIASKNYELANDTAQTALQSARATGNDLVINAATLQAAIAEFRLANQENQVVVSKQIATLDELIPYFLQMEKIALLRQSYEWLIELYQLSGANEAALETFQKLFTLEQQRLTHQMQNAIYLLGQFTDYEKRVLNRSFKDTQPTNTKNKKPASFSLIGQIALAGLVLLAIVLIYEHWTLMKVKEKLHQSRDQLQELTLKDPLTKLHNRRYFLNEIEDRVTKTLTECANGDGDKKMAILVLDIDFFKKINDTHGHHIGDEILSSFAAILRQFCKEDDLVVRWGGEEFVIVTQNVQWQSLGHYCKALLDEVTKEPIQTSAQKVSVTCSIGACLLPLFSKNPKLYDWSKTMDVADQALYQAKENGRNQALIVHSATGYEYHEDNGMKLSALIQNQCISVNCIFP